MIDELEVTTATAVLDAIARALKAATVIGINPRAEHGVIVTDVGYVVPTSGETWDARLNATTSDRFYLGRGDHDDLDD